MYRLGNSDAIIINDLSLKNKIIDYLFNSIDISNFRYNMLDNMQKLHYLKDNIHYLSPNFKGYNYFIIFTKINNLNYCCLIDKKKLSYHRNKVNVKNTNIFKIKINPSNSIYNGTILDCKLIKKENRYYMMIKDCYMMMGNNILNMEMKDKMKFINCIINNQFSGNDCKNFKFKINRLYEYDDLKNVVENIIPKCEIEIMGLIFYPKFSGITTIYMEKKVEKVEISNNTEKIDNNSYHLIKNIVEFLSEREYSYENGKIVKLIIEKTNITDVYNLYENNERIGIAHIPNIKTSIYLQNNIDNDKKEVECVFSKKFNKYIPIKLL